MPGTAESNRRSSREAADQLARKRIPVAGFRGIPVVPEEQSRLGSEAPKSLLRASIGSTDNIPSSVCSTRCTVHVTPEAPCA